MTRDVLLPADSNEGIPIHLVSESELAEWQARQPPYVRRWLSTHDFKAERQRMLLVPNAQGELAEVVLGVGPTSTIEALNLWQVAGLPERLPPGVYRLDQDLGTEAARQFSLGWLIGGYRYQRYRSAPLTSRPSLRVPAGVQREDVVRLAEACAMARDLINCPANDLGPAELAETAQAVAAAQGAQCRCLVGDELLAAGYPLIHAVGRASARAPRLIDLRWGDPSHPRVTLVGKGVCFDSGGLDIKPSSGMALMKKDMGGAAIALALARALMQRHAPLQLRVLIPAVENAIGGAAFRPGDVLPSRRGLTVEIGNTDAEGRLVLADALAEADREAPSVLIDFATLTGAARVALGPELPALFGKDQALVTALHRAGDQEADPVWPLPLWDSYDDELTSRVADIGNVAASPHAGAIFGALFLRRFVSSTTRWAHFDLFAWNARERPGRPVGAEAQCLRLVDRYLRETFG
ncbi:MAG: leucyl aminopeptidase family protein [Steroidobacteraceae bacterium]